MSANGPVCSGRSPPGSRRSRQVVRPVRSGISHADVPPSRGHRTEPEDVLVRSARTLVAVAVTVLAADVRNPSSPRRPRRRWRRPGRCPRARSRPRRRSPSRGPRCLPDVRRRSDRGTGLRGRKGRRRARASDRRRPAGLVELRRGARGPGLPSAHDRLPRVLPARRRRLFRRRWDRRRLARPRRGRRVAPRPRRASDRPGRGEHGRDRGHGRRRGARVRRGRRGLALRTGDLLRDDAGALGVASGGDPDAVHRRERGRGGRRTTPGSSLGGPIRTPRR